MTRYPCRGVPESLVEPCAGPGLPFTLVTRIELMGKRGRLDPVPTLRTYALPGNRCRIPER